MNVINNIEIKKNYKENKKIKISGINTSNKVIERRRFNNVELDESDEHINSPKTNINGMPIYERRTTDSMAYLH